MDTKPLTNVDNEALLSELQQRAGKSPEFLKQALIILANQIRPNVGETLVKEDKPTPAVPNATSKATEEKEVTPDDLEKLAELWNEEGVKWFNEEDSTHPNSGLPPVFENKGWSRVFLEDYKSLLCVRRKLNDDEVEILFFPKKALSYEVMTAFFIPKDRVGKESNSHEDYKKYADRIINKIFRPARLLTISSQKHFYWGGSIGKDLEKGIGEFPDPKKSQ